MVALKAPSRKPSWATSSKRSAATVSSPFTPERVNSTVSSSWPSCTVHSMSNFCSTCSAQAQAISRAFLRPRSCSRWMRISAKAALHGVLRGTLRENLGAAAPAPFARILCGRQERGRPSPPPPREEPCALSTRTRTASTRSTRGWPISAPPSPTWSRRSTGSALRPMPAIPRPWPCWATASLKAWACHATPRRRASGWKAPAATAA
mmetsp:Transcript_26213/g.61847  ORF Transcript_26213/g.61847 Transcript_26213/m.61847 type:complete len:207 (+) Transcript_26213:739-1359(+)